MLILDSQFRDKPKLAAAGMACDRKRRRRRDRDVSEGLNLIKFDQNTTYSLWHQFWQDQEWYGSQTKGKASYKHDDTDGGQYRL